MSAPAARHAGALSGLQRNRSGERGIEWAARDRALGQFVYSTYTEADYDVVWDEYLYISRDNWWVKMDFGKRNCSVGQPRRADMAANLQEAWVQEVCLQASNSMHVYGSHLQPFKV
jgi:hypothetical protein